ncbi:hypothetical protein Nepgr_000269 [Nepenthes gracilis]|uniref:Uncharacterized protein n=1 Tax=Nepenthes gracilis TaxID=150966 RepID=A0AAD3RWK0_NEPGR|nr:hypothetical protein Nepgr_000269 [Nepenthes gracilis]
MDVLRALRTVTDIILDTLMSDSETRNPQFVKPNKTCSQLKSHPRHGITITNFESNINSRRANSGYDGGEQGRESESMLSGGSTESERWLVKNVKKLGLPKCKGRWIIAVETSKEAVSDVDIHYIVEVGNSFELKFQEMDYPSTLQCELHLIKGKHCIWRGCHCILLFTPAGKHFTLLIKADSTGPGKSIMTIALVLTNSERGGSPGSQSSRQSSANAAVDEILDAPLVCPMTLQGPC